MSAPNAPNAPNAPIDPPAAAPARNPAWWQGRLALVAVLAAGALHAFLPGAEDEAPLGPAPYHVGVFARHGGVVAPVPAGGEIAAGDALLFATWAEEARHVAVILVDAGGGAVIAFPAGEPALHGAGRGVPLPSSPVAAATPGPLAIHAFFCARPIDPEPVRAALAAGQRPAPAGCAVDRTDVVVAAR